MSLMLFASIVLTFYVMLWFFDSFFKSCMHYPYYAFLNGTGLHVGFLKITWMTTAFNRCVYRWSRKLSRILHKWYTFGYIFTIFVFLPFSIWALIATVIEHFSVEIRLSHAPEVKAIVPGFNVPIHDFWAYFLAIAFCSIFHELGHAFSAVLEDVHLLSFGVSVFTIIPMAFVELNTEQLHAIAINKRLKIYCAGVWHNVALGFVALILFFSTPLIFDFGYETGIGVAVKEITFDSPLRGLRGLQEGDVILDISDCEIKKQEDWGYCLHALANHRYGLCVSEKYVSQNDEILMESIKDNDLVDCCRGDDKESLCFEYMEPKVGEATLAGQYSCLKPREIIRTEPFIKCTEKLGNYCPTELHCLKPILDNATYLMFIDRKDRDPVIFLGSAYDLYKTVTVDQYFPRNAFFALFSPQAFEKLIKYIFIFSMGIAFLNIIPCYGSDGHHIARNLIQVLAKKLGKGSDFVTFFTVFAVVIGTGVTVPTLVYLFAVTIRDN